MRYHCSHCHTLIETEGDAEPERCPNCRAEIGFELIRGIPSSIKMFGCLLAFAVATAALGGLLARTMG